MPSAVINLVKGDKVSTKTEYRDALPVNMVAINKPVRGVEGYMVTADGLTEFTQGQGVCRGAFYNDRFSEMYHISGGSLIRVNANKTTNTLGVVAGVSTASLAYSFNTQSIVSDGRWYLYDPTSGFREITDPDLGEPLDHCWIDQYYFFTDGENIYHTEITDEESIDPLQFATAEFMPDKSLGVSKTYNNQIIVWGRYSMEYFRNVASENFAFTRLAEKGQKIGIAGTFCKVEIEEQFYIMGGRRDESISFHAVSTGQTQSISTREIDLILGQYTETELSASVLETRKEDGIVYLIAHLPNHTLLLNLTVARKSGVSQAWTILQSSNKTNYRAIHGAFFPKLGQWLYGDKIGATIGLIDDSVCTQYDQEVEWLLYTPFIEIETGSIDELEIETIAGFTGSDDSSVFVSLSYDGYTYGKQWSEAYGSKQQYDKRFIMRRLGYVRDTVSVRLRGLTPTKMAFSRCTLNYG